MQPVTERDEEELEAKLEKLVDACSYARVLVALARVGAGKADHIAHAWQDVGLSQRWRKASSRLGFTAMFAQELGL